MREHGAVVGNQWSGGSEVGQGGIVTMAAYAINCGDIAGTICIVLLQVLDTVYVLFDVKVTFGTVDCAIVHCFDTSDCSIVATGTQS